MKKSQARLDAIKAGHATYVPEKPCQKGHSLRSVYGTCIECRREQEKSRYHADPEKTKQKVKAKYTKNAERLRQKRREAYAANPDKEKLVAKFRSAEWRKNNLGHEGSKIAKRAYKKNNPGKVLADTVKRRAAKLQRTPSWLTSDDHWIMEQAYELASMRTKLFGFSWHVDHIIPLQGKLASGFHTPYNLQVIPAAENISKSNKFIPA
jgi:hypothetical protein